VQADAALKRRSSTVVRAIVQASLRVVTRTLKPGLTVRMIATLKALRHPKQKENKKGTRKRAPL
jgi:hypothetical protein